MGTVTLQSFLGGRWRPVTGRITNLVDPTNGEEIAVIGSQDLDYADGLAHARAIGGGALRSLNYAERANLLQRIAEVLTANRAAYFDIALRNSGSPASDAAIDIDGAIYTLKYFAKAGAPLGTARFLLDGGLIRLAKDEGFQGQHVLTPSRGVAVLINAFNFPAWGLWEKAAPALLSGVPILVKPATSTAWLAHRMISDVLEAGVLPEGALSLICGSTGNLLDALRYEDAVSFTGSATTSMRIRGHENILRRSIRVNVEADSINSAVLGPDAGPGSVEFELFVNEVVREMTVKAGQKCTAIRRAFVPLPVIEAASEALASKLRKIVVGNPRNTSVQMGPLVNRAQLDAARSGLKVLQRETTTVYEPGPGDQLIDADRAVGAFLPPTLLRCDDPDAAKSVHDVEVFGPVATLIPYDTPADALNLIRRGEGSLVASLFSADTKFLDVTATELADSHGRVLAVNASVAKSQTGHGNVMPMCLHGGPGRAGGGDELGGLRSLLFHHRRTALQAPLSVLESVRDQATQFNA